MRLLLLTLFALMVAACDPTVDTPDPGDGGMLPPSGEDPRCPNRIVPSQPCAIERLNCPLYDENTRCTCISDEWRCGV